jgi:hypothetical protein
MVREGLGLIERGYEGETCSMERLGSLWVAKVFQLSFDTVAGVPSVVFDLDVEH